MVKLINPIENDAFKIDMGPRTVDLFLPFYLQALVQLYFFLATLKNHSCLPHWKNYIIILIYPQPINLYYILTEQAPPKKD